MGIAIAVHSYKGGTGKSSISLNMSILLARDLGKKVLLLDFDFQGPSLCHIFDEPVLSNTINQYLNNECSIKEAILDKTSKLDLKDENSTGKLHVGLSSSRAADIEMMASQTRKWHTKALGKLLRDFTELKRIYDYIIIDTSPGVTFDSLNAMAISDFVLVLSRVDKTDFLGTKELVNGISKHLSRLGAITLIIINRVPPLVVNIEEIRRKFELKIEAPVISIIPCYCDISAFGGISEFYLVKYSNHPIKYKFLEIIDEIHRELENKPVK
ncbi:MAG: MinD/ParA family ATP-binding protein [Candidatus Hodarchaeales archaeon]